MRARKALALMVILAAVAGGCATRTAADLEYARSARRSIAATLSRFAEAVRDKDAAAAAALLSPDVPSAHRVRMEQAIKQAVWMELYTGYRLDVERAVARPGWRKLRDGRAVLKVAAANAAGVEFQDRFVAERRESDWFLSDVLLQEPVAYERLDPPAEAAREICAVLEYIFRSLEEEKPGRVLVMLPDAGALRYRASKRTFWQSLFGGQPETYSIDEDLNTLCDFAILAWPDPAKDLPLAFVAPGTVVACYDIPYHWFGAGIGRPDDLRMEIFLHLRQGRWKLLTFRLYGEGIPGT